MAGQKLEWIIYFLRVSIDILEKNHTPNIKHITYLYYIYKSHMSDVQSNLTLNIQNLWYKVQKLDHEFKPK